MVSTWLNKASTALLCALAMSQVVQSLPSSGSIIQETVEEMHFDKLGNMIWPSEDAIPSLGRPDFLALDVKKMESEAIRQSKAWLGKAEDSTSAVLAKIENNVEDVLHSVQDTLTAIQSEFQHTAQDWIHKGEVVMDGMMCECL